MMTYSILLGNGNLLDSESVVEQTVAREVLAHVLLHELDTQIRVVDALDLVADTGDCTVRQCLRLSVANDRWLTELVLLAAAVDELARRETGVARVREHRGGLVEGTTEAATDRQETRAQ